MGPRNAPNDSTDASLRCVELGCNVNLPHPSGIKAAHLKNVGFGVFRVPVLLAFGSDLVRNSAKSPERMQRIRRGGTNLKVFEAVVVFDSVQMVDDIPVRDGANKRHDNGAMNLVELACLAGATAAPREKVGVPVFVALKFEDDAPASHSTTVGNAEAFVQRERLPRLIH